MSKQMLCSTHHFYEADLLCLEESCNFMSPCCELCVELSHKSHEQQCISKYKIENHIIREVIFPLEQIAMNKLQEMYDLTYDTFQRIRKGIKEKFSQNLQTDILAQRSKEDLPLFVTRLQALEININNLSESLKNALQYSQDSILNSNVEKGRAIVPKPQEPEPLENKLQQKPKQIKSDSPIKIQQVLDKKYEMESNFGNRAGYNALRGAASLLILSSGVNSLFADQIMPDKQINDSLKNYDEILQDLKQHNEKFFDEEFPATISSIGIQMQCQWKRASEFNGQQMKFFPKNSGNIFGQGESVKSSDVILGTIGNDLVFGVVYYLANHCPKLLEECFIKKEICPQGIYPIRLYNQLQEEDLIYVDDQFPFDERNQLHATLMGTDYSIWICILEKALAKKYGSYYRLFNQHFSKIIEKIISAPLVLLKSRNDEFFEELQQQLRHQALILVHPMDDIDNKGLVLENFYQVVNTVTIQHPTQEEVMLLQLRNPWGAKQWKGDWGHSSQYWTSQLRAQLNLEKIDDGFFYMDIISFMQQFVNVYCYRVFDKQQEPLMISCRQNQAVYCKLQIPQQQNCVIQVIATLSKDKSNQGYQHKRLIVFKVEDDNSYTIVDCQVSNINAAFDFNAVKGTYILYLKIVWQHSNLQDAKINVSGYTKINIVQIQKIQNLLYSGFMKAAMTNGIQSQTDICFTKSLDWLEKGWSALLLKNKTTRAIPLTISYDQFDHAKLCKPYSGNKALVNLGPNEQKIVIVKCYLMSAVIHFTINLGGKN